MLIGTAIRLQRNKCSSARSTTALRRLCLRRWTRFRDLTKARTDYGVGTRRRLRSDWFGIAAKTMLALTAALFLGVLYFVLKRRMAMPLCA